nr:MAG TPA: hypothetical protein [Caudoviricetes sp.]
MSTSISEAVWHNFSNLFIIITSTALNEKLKPN